MLCFCNSQMDIIEIGKYKFYKCVNCGHLKKINLVTNEEEYNRYLNHVCDDNYLSYMNKVYEVIKPYLNSGNSLDYGCGKIHALADILNKNNQVCDYYDLYFYPNINNKKYDNIILIEVFEHVYDNYGLIKSLLAMLNDNGSIIIQTQFIPNDPTNWWYFRDVTHVSFFDEKSILELSRVFNLDVKIDKEKSLFVLNKKV